jgi:hypothetical protein
MASSTQQLLPIDTIREDMVILKGGFMRAILSVSSLNFALKSAEEQEAIIFEYQNFLNSLEFPLQIFVTSRFTNVDGYLETLQQQYYLQKSPLLQMQTQEYIKFVKTFTENTDVVSTDFYLVVPFSSIEVRTEQGGALDRLKTTASVGATDYGALTRYRGDLMQRVDFVAAGLHRIGLRARVLTTPELVALYWSLYNSGDLKKKGIMRSIFEG